MQEQSPGYKPMKKAKGVVVGSQGVRTGTKPKTGNNLKLVPNRQKKPRSVNQRKKLAGKKTSLKSPRSTAMNEQFQNMQPRSQFNFPGASPLL